MERYEGNPAAEGEAAARRDARQDAEAETARQAARTIALASIDKLQKQLAEVSDYLRREEILSALGTLQRFEEETKNIIAAERLLRMAMRG